MLKPLFKRVVLYARQYRANAKVNESLKRLVRFLALHPLDIFVEAETLTYFDLPLPALTSEQMQADTDLLIVVGGDGSLLSAARMATQVHVPVIGINRGRLGFLTDISPQALEDTLTQVLQGDFWEEERFLLSANTTGSTPSFTSMALNDVVLSRGNEPHLIDFEVQVNQGLVSRYRADGLIVATPTGSTAYALSAGGPIMHPKLNAIVLVPMFSHSLSSRPLVIDGDDEITLKVTLHNESNQRLSCDGHESQMISPGAVISIKKHQKRLRLLHPFDYHYYDTLRSKLGWEAKHQG
ncbi:MAG: NAD(+) kinase [Legionellaceae bacterium]|nr:NAD(+) kinase [Legionellaceae bacterium]HAF86934.1 NAD(+) kinase [Legionellales bacterium]HCA89263.1 NAD(+) kinase [Legionellales bacterium]|tara:strand:+ start:1465 stop:2352 length:888 start_codon:yes stop_codon:yes gene_type:complete